MGFRRDSVRLLVIPGLHDSGPTHWQSWLQSRSRHSLRVQQRDWAAPDLQRWANRIDETLAAQPPARWVAVAHSFGCLALLRHLATRPPGEHAVRSALLVAPADPDKFGVAALLPRDALTVPAVLVASETDPWMSLAKARAAAGRWGAQFVNLGDAGHINVEAGFGPLPLAASLVNQLTQRAERERRIDRAHPLELSFSI